MNVGQTVYTSSYGNISEERILPIKIKEITKVKCKKHVYDIEVKDNHNFFAGGILNHNCQNCFSARKALNKKWIATEKIDGTSTTFTMRQAKPRKRKMLVCSRNIVYDTPKKEEKNFYKDTDGNVYLEMASKYGIEKILNYMLTTAPDLEYVTIQGETYGGTIQKRNYGPEHRLAIFNIIGKFKGEAPIRLNPIKMVECIESLNEECGANLESVPSLGYLELPETCDELLALAGGKSLIDGQPREGIVLRSEDGVDSFKAVDNGYLEKYHG